MKNNNEKGWETPSCNLCGSNNYNTVWSNAPSWLNKGVFRIVKCRKCKLVCLSPRPSQEVISKYYNPDYYWGIDLKKDNLNKEFEKRDKAYNTLYKNIFERNKVGSILDIGAGTGLFLSKFKEKGWNIDGVELSKQTCKFAKQTYDIELRCGDLLKQSIPTNIFDVVTLNGCLEHLHKPKETMIKITKLLKKDAVLVITVPNFDGIGRVIFGKEWYAVQPPTHLYHFTPKTLRNMLELAGFKIKKIKHNYWHHNYYILFESIRLLYSPKFRNSKASFKYKNISRKSKHSFLLEFGKLFAKMFAFILASLEPVFKKGEVITVYAEKA